jgi:hypothetical protein
MGRIGSEYGGIRVAQIRMVQDVEEFGAELNESALTEESDLGVFDHGEIHVP